MPILVMRSPNLATCDRQRWPRRAHGPDARFLGFGQVGRHPECCPDLQRAFRIGLPGDLRRVLNVRAMQALRFRVSRDLTFPPSLYRHDPAKDARRSGKRQTSEQRCQVLPPIRGSAIGDNGAPSTPDRGLREGLLWNLASAGPVTCECR